MMGGLLKWELKQTFSSKAFWITGAALVAIPALMLMMTLKDGDFTGYEAYLEGLNNYSSFMMLMIGVFAGIHVTGAFEGRKIQAAAFVAYFLIPIGQKRLRPVVVCMYTYVQPVIAMVIAMAMGLDHLTVLKVVATLLVFIGVGLVNFAPKRGSV